MQTSEKHGRGCIRDFDSLSVMLFFNSLLITFKVSIIFETAEAVDNIGKSSLTAKISKLRNTKFGRIDL
jgi:hypothetical protein